MLKKTTECKTGKELLMRARAFHELDENGNPMSKEREMTKIEMDREMNSFGNV